jgi:glycosyltransferase involved in cell wall biosynthesis
VKPYLSIIIPTYNRAEKLEKTLEYLHTQSLSLESYEIIVVNDGSTDQTEELLKKWTAKSSVVHALHQKNAGQGVARNHGLKKAEGEVVLFIGDDIYATENFLLSHVRFHQDHPEENAACLGITEWEEPSTPFMNWLTHGGPQFAYDKLKSGQEASFWFFYTSNLSLKTSLLIKESFDEDFKGYGWEDIELGYRLHKNADLKLIYTPEALATHDHAMEEKDLERKMLSIGKTAKIFQTKHPELQVIPGGIKKILLTLVSSLPTLLLLKILSPLGGKELYWFALSKRYFLRGVNSL